MIFLRDRFISLSACAAIILSGISAAFACLNSQSQINAAAVHFVPEEAFEYNGHFYAFYDDLQNMDNCSWETAKRLCKARGGHLAVIDDAEENEMLYSELQKAGYDMAFFGLYLDGDVWKRVDGEELEYTNWLYDSTYAPYAMYFYSSQWQSGEFSTSTDTTVYICEWDSGEYYIDAVECDEDNNPKLPKDTLKFGDSVYKVYRNALTAQEARKFCEKQGGHLIYINSQEEQDFIFNELQDSGTKNMYWIGAVESSGSWVWSDGTDISYSNWSANEPANSDGDSKYSIINLKSENYDKGGWVAQSNIGAEYREAEYYPNYGFICEWEYHCQDGDKRYVFHESSDEWEVLKSPGCETEGKNIQKCTRCDKVVNTKVIEQLGHDYELQRLTEKFNFNPFPGIEKYKCTRCDEVKYEPNEKALLIDAAVLAVLIVFIAACVSAKKELKKKTK